MAFRSLNQSHNICQCCALAGCSGANDQSATLVVCSCINGIPRGFEDRTRFPCQHGLIRLTFSLQHPAIDRRGVSGTQQESVPYFHLVHGNLGTYIFGIQPTGLIGKPLMQALPAYGQPMLHPLFEPMTQTDDSQDAHRFHEVEMGELVGEESPETQTKGSAGSQRDQGIHSHPFLFELIPCTKEKLTSSDPKRHACHEKTQPSVMGCVPPPEAPLHHHHRQEYRPRKTDMPKPNALVKKPKPGVFFRKLTAEHNRFETSRLEDVQTSLFFGKNS